MRFSSLAQSHASDLDAVGLVPRQGQGQALRAGQPRHVVNQNFYRHGVGRTATGCRMNLRIRRNDLDSGAEVSLWVSAIPNAQAGVPTLAYR